ncbi:MAG TPA: DUF6358 family protein [Sphingobacteriaceae bacterium]|nr:DUF6358 family protein [Sphingobacteriaceae bacterium]
MAKKILLNILLNIAIITIVLSAIWSFNNGHYGLLIGAIGLLSMLIFLKIRLVKSVRALTKKKL